MNNKGGGGLCDSRSVQAPMGSGRRQRRRRRRSSESAAAAPPGLCSKQCHCLALVKNSHGGRRRRQAHRRRVNEGRGTHAHTHKQRFFPAPPLPALSLSRRRSLARSCLPTETDSRPATGTPRHSLNRMRCQRQAANTKNFKFNFPFGCIIVLQKAQINYYKIRIIKLFIGSLSI